MYPSQVLAHPVGFDMSGGPESTLVRLPLRGQLSLGLRLPRGPC